jgi:hypothetical protein
VWLAYVLSIAGAALCVGYGLVNWNKAKSPCRRRRGLGQGRKSEVEDAL